MSHIDGKTIVVTGAASGFGRLVSALSLERGANVVGIDVDGDAVAGTFAELAGTGTGTGLGLQADVTDAAALAAAVDEAVARFGSLDVMVNNAGVMPLAFLADHGRALDAWDRCIDINLKGVLHGICAAHDHMIGQGHGHIVNISSIYGNAGVAGAAVYSATKAAVNVLSNALRVETQGAIKVTVVRPTGVPSTGLIGTMIDPAAAVPLAAHNAERFMVNAGAVMGGTAPPEQTDPASIRYWTIAPEELAAQILYVIDQPLGVNIAEITVRATGEDYVF